MTLFSVLLVILCGCMWGYILHRCAQYLIRGGIKQEGPCSDVTTLVMAALFTPFLCLLTIIFFAPWYQPAVILFCSILLVASFTDVQTLLISRFTSLFLVPIGWLCAWLGFIPVSLGYSVLGSVAGYSMLSVVAFLFYAMTKKQGLGQGDSDLLALIGAFTGSAGVWFSVLYGSILGALVGTMLLLIRKASRSTPLPFAPFLTLGVFLYLFGQPFLARCFMPGHLVLL